MGFLGGKKHPPPYTQSVQRREEERGSERQEVVVNGKEIKEGEVENTLFDLQMKSWRWIVKIEQQRAH